MKIIILDDIDEPLKIELKKAIERMANPAETIPAPTPVFNPNPAPEDTKLVKKLQDAMENTTYKPSPKTKAPFGGPVQEVGGVIPCDDPAKEIGKTGFEIRPGTFEWALIQMKVGRKVRRPGWGIALDWVIKKGDQLMLQYAEPAYRDRYFRPKIEDVLAEDWQIVT